VLGINHEASSENDSALESKTDEAVINLICLGETKLYSVIMRRYNQRLFRTARSILKNDDDAQDAVQEAYISAFFKLDSYESTGKFAAWLTRITVNEALMIKRKPVNKIFEKSFNETVITARGNPADTLANKELAGLIEVAIDALPDNFRIVFVLRAVQQLSVRETALSLDIKEATVKTRFLRAREQMQLFLNKHIQDVGLHAFEFAGQRCDNIVMNVFKRLDSEICS